MFVMVGIAVVDNPSAFLRACIFGLVVVAPLSLAAYLAGGAVLWVKTMESTLATISSIFIVFGILIVAKISYPTQFAKWWPISLIIIGVFGLSATVTLQARPWINAISVTAGTVCCFLVPTKTDHREFYELTAQIVPVLFIALVTVPVSYLPALALVAAGFEALRVLANGNPSTGNFRFVVASMVIATVSLALLAILGSDEQHLL